MLCQRGQQLLRIFFVAAALRAACIVSKSIYLTPGKTSRKPPTKLFDAADRRYYPYFVAYADAPVAPDITRKRNIIIEAFRKFRLKQIDADLIARFAYSAYQIKRMHPFAAVYIPRGRTNTMTVLYYSSAARYIA